MNQDESLYSVNINLTKDSNKIWISVFNNDSLAYQEWRFSEIEVDGKKIKFDILDLKYFKINKIENFKELIYWINIDINQYSNIEKTAYEIEDD
jgi:hypothetical protein